MSIIIGNIEYSVITNVDISSSTFLLLELDSEFAVRDRAMGLIKDSAIILVAVGDTFKIVYQSFSSRPTTNSDYHMQSVIVKPKSSFDMFISSLKPLANSYRKWKIGGSPIIKYGDNNRKAEISRDWDKVDYLSDKVMWLCDISEKDREVKVKDDMLDLLTRGMFDCFDDKITLKSFTGIDPILWPFIQKLDAAEALDRYELYQKKAKNISYPLDIDIIETYLLLGEYKIRVKCEGKIIREASGINAITIGDTRSGYLLLG